MTPKAEVGKQGSSSWKQIHARSANLVYTEAVVSHTEMISQTMSIDTGCQSWFMLNLLITILQLWKPGWGLHIYINTNMQASLTEQVGLFH